MAFSINSCTFIPSHIPPNDPRPPPIVWKVYPPKKSFIEIIKQPFQHIKDAFMRTRIGRFLNKNKDYKTVVINGVIGGIRLVNAGTSLSDMLAKGAKNVSSASKGFWVESGLVARAVKYTEFLGAAGAPLAVYNISKGTRDIVKGGLDQKIDAFLLVTSELGSLMESASVVVHALESVKVVASAALNWASTLGIVGTGLSVVLIIAKARGWWQTHQFLKEINEKIEGKEYSIEDYIDTLNIIKAKESYFLKKVFDQDGEKLKISIDKIVQIALKQKEIEDPIKTLKNTFKCLEKRLTANKWSKVMSIVTLSVSVIGLGILLLSPLAPLGYALMAAVSGVNIVKFFYDKVSGRRFEKQLLDLAYPVPYG